MSKSILVQFAHSELNYITSHNEDVSISTVRDYFKGQVFDRGVFPVENMQTCTEVLNFYDDDCEKLTNLKDNLKAFGYKGVYYKDTRCVGFYNSGVHILCSFNNHKNKLRFWLGDDYTYCPDVSNTLRHTELPDQPNNISVGKEKASTVAKWVSLKMLEHNALIAISAQRIEKVGTFLKSFPHKDELEEGGRSWCKEYNFHKYGKFATYTLQIDRSGGIYERTEMKAVSTDALTLFNKIEKE